MHMHKITCGNDARWQDYHNSIKNHRARRIDIPCAFAGATDNIVMWISPRTHTVKDRWPFSASVGIFVPEFFIVFGKTTVIFIKFSTSYFGIFTYKKKIWLSFLVQNRPFKTSLETRWFFRGQFWWTELLVRRKGMTLSYPTVHSQHA